MGGVPPRGVRGPHADGRASVPNPRRHAPTGEEEPSKSRAVSTNVKAPSVPTDFASMVNRIPPAPGSAQESIWGMAKTVQKVNTLIHTLTRTSAQYITIFFYVLQGVSGVSGFVSQMVDGKPAPPPTQRPEKRTRARQPRYGDTNSRSTDR